MFSLTTSLLSKYSKYMVRVGSLMKVYHSVDLLLGVDIDDVVTGHSVVTGKGSDNFDGEQRPSLNAFKGRLSLARK